jgi:hypothetical protein
MPKEKQRAIAAMGGKAAHALVPSHRWTREDAARAGKIGSRTGKRKRHRWVDDATVMHWIRIATLEADTIRAGRRNRHRIKKAAIETLELPPRSIDF